MDKKEVEKFIGGITDKCQDGDYIFRGVNKKYGAGYNRVSSSLYRWANKSENKSVFHKRFLPQDMEEDLVKEAKIHFPENTSNKEIVTEIQHYGGKTNCIDFTRNLHVALFFACNGEHQKNGELFLLNTDGLAKSQKIKYKKDPKPLEIIEPTHAQSSKIRVLFQGSVFVRPAEGYIDMGQLQVIPIKQEEKLPILKHLKMFHHIDENTIYNDIFGFVQNQRSHDAASLYYFYKGLSLENEVKYEESIKKYGQAIELSPKLAEAYNNRGNVYGDLGKHNEALKDLDKAIELNPKFADAYNNRGVAYGEMGDYKRSLKDLDKAIELNPGYAEAYNNRGLAKQKLGDAKGAEEDFKKAKEPGLEQPSPK